LLAKGARLDVKGRYGSTPLHWAARNGHTTVAELLVAHKADVNAVNQRGLTPLGVALKNGRAEMAEQLRRLGARE
jgi:ankyrin repeat protein